MKDVFYKEFRTINEFSEEDNHKILNYSTTEECVSIEIKIDAYRYMLEEQRLFRNMYPEFGIIFKKNNEDECVVDSFNISENCLPCLYKGYNINHGAKYFLNKSYDSLISFLINIYEVFREFYRYMNNDEDVVLECRTFYELVLIIGIEADI